MAAPELILRCTSSSAGQTEALAQRLAGRLRAGNVLALRGPLGAGKTCFVRGLAQGLGIDPEAVSSPTFVICHVHEGPRLRLVHVDAYRLAGSEELLAIGWEEFLADGRTVAAVEWPERVESALPTARIEIEFRHVELSTRDLILSAPPEMADRLHGLELKALG